MKKSIIYKLSPFNNSAEISVPEYIIKKILAFILIYCISAVIGELIIIWILYSMGYNPLQGEIPVGVFGELLPYYGFIVYLLVTFAYCRIIEKETVKSIGFSGKAADYAAGALLAVVLLLVIISICWIFGSIVFEGLSTNVKTGSLVLWAIGFGIQGAAEEIMCRGFLMKSLLKRTSAPIAVMISSTAFVVPHLSSLLESDIIYAIVGIINLYLMSAVFSVLVLRRSNIWIACGLHSIWNFILHSIMGLSLSGSESTSNGVVLFRVNGANILNGAEYGIEASIITTVVLGILLIVTVNRRKGRINKNGIQ